MNKYKEFLAANGLKQYELADFLCVTESAISNLVNGKSGLSEEKLIKILGNDRGWDVSMLKPGLSSVIGDNNTGVIVNSNNVHQDNRQYYSDSPDVLRAQIDLLDERLKEKDAQIKEKDAQINRLLDLLQSMQK